MALGAIMTAVTVASLIKKGYDAYKDWKGTKELEDISDTLLATDAKSGFIASGGMSAAEMKAAADAEQQRMLAARKTADGPTGEQLQTFTDVGKTETLGKSAGLALGMGKEIEREQAMIGKGLELKAFLKGLSAEKQVAAKPLNVAGAAEAAASGEATDAAAVGLELLKAAPTATGIG